MKTESLGTASSLEMLLTSLCIIPSQYITNQQSFGGWGEWLQEPCKEIQRSRQTQGRQGEIKKMKRTWLNISKEQYHSLTQGWKALSICRTVSSCPDIPFLLYPVFLKKKKKRIKTLGTPMFRRCGITWFLWYCHCTEVNEREHLLKEDP